MLRTPDAIGCELIADVLSLSGSARLRVTGSSMLPSILPGDVLTVQRLGSNEVRAGDVVVIRRNGRLFAHRLIGHCGRVPQPITRGDSLSRSDAPVPAEEFLGRITSIRRQEKRITLKSTLGKRVISVLLQRSEFLTRCVVWLLNHKRRRA
jgi:Peptidase S24-like